MTGIDTMIMIYAGILPKKGAPADLTDLQVRARLLFYQLRQETIVLPMIAVSELLVPIPAQQKGALAAELTSQFVCAPFDLPAASIASSLWAKHKSLPADLQYKQRQVLRADAMIVATAKAAGATVFYSHDKRCRALADIVMTGRDLPKQSDAEDMFIIDDIKRGEV